MNAKRRRKSSLDDVIGEGIVIEESGLVRSTEQLTERNRVEGLLRHWNDSSDQAWEVIERPDKITRNRPAADFLCRDRESGKSALIDVAELHLTENFLTNRVQGQKDFTFNSREFVDNASRLLEQKDKQLASDTVDLRCVLFFFGYASDAARPWIDLMKAIDLDCYAHIDEVYMWSGHTWDPVTRVLPR